jgi:hypothetical protein
MRGDTEKIKKTFPLNLHWGTYKVRNEIETKLDFVSFRFYFVSHFIGTLAFAGFVLFRFHFVDFVSFLLISFRFIFVDFVSFRFALYRYPVKYVQ